MYSSFPLNLCFVLCCTSSLPCIRFFLSFRTISFTAHQISKHMLNYIPMRSIGIVHKSVDDSYGMSNVKSCCSYADCFVRLEFRCLLGLFLLHISDISLISLFHPFHGHLPDRFLCPPFYGFPLQPGRDLLYIHDIGYHHIYHQLFFLNLDWALATIVPFLLAIIVI